MGVVVNAFGRINLCLGIANFSEIYRANALPSAGAMPFLQTVLCDLNGGRDPYQTDMPVYPNAT